MLLFVAYKYCLSTIILKEATHMCQFFEQLWIDPKMIALTDLFCHLDGWPPIRKGAIESLKGDESFRICSPNN
jgi:hypothetical protein